MIAHCLFEQSGTFKNEFKKLGIESYDYDIQNDLSYLKKAYPGKIVSRPGKYNGGIEWVED